MVGYEDWKPYNWYEELCLKYDSDFSLNTHHDVMKVWFASKLKSRTNIRIMRRPPQHDEYY